PRLIPLTLSLSFSSSVAHLHLHSFPTRRSSDLSALIPLWVILIGIGSGSAFSLSMMFFTLRTTTVRQASELSGMAQSLGYLVAATGPVLFGKLYDVFGAWDAPLYLLLGCSAFLVFVGWQASRDRLIPQ